MNKCLNCDKSFHVKPYRKETAKYCSYNCYWGKSENKQEKECTKCNRTLSVDCFNIINRGFGSQCKDCRARENRNWRRRNIPEEKFRNYKYRSKLHDRAFKMTLDDFLDKIKSGECFYCGTLGSMGLDRVDSSLGYTKENTVVCCRRCNIAKNDMSQSEFFLLCKSVVKKHGI